MSFRRWGAIAASLAMASAAFIVPGAATARETGDPNRGIATVAPAGLVVGQPESGDETALGEVSETTTAPDYGDPGEQLALPAMTGELLEASTSIDARLSADPRFNVVEVLPDRSGLAVWWFGEPSDVLRSLMSESKVAVAIRQTLYLPGDLRSVRDRLMAEEASFVAIATVPREGDGVDVQLKSDHGAGSRGATDGRAAIDDFSERVDVPVNVEGFATVDPASRMNDVYVMGGAKVHRWDGTKLTGSCTTGFPAQNAAGEKGVMFAAHCGSGQWVRYPNDTGTTVYAYGNDGTSSLSTVGYDGRIIQTTFNNPGFYTGGSTSTTYTALNGTATPPIGSEICYSGQPSGLICGNIVQSKSVVSVSGFGTVTGYITQQSVNTPAVGNGDSGGPGYMLVSVGGTLKRYGATIISATIGSSINCTGEPGFGDPNVNPYYRWCSSTVLSTGVSDISATLGWTLSIIP